MLGRAVVAEPGGEGYRLVMLVHAELGASVLAGVMVVAAGGLKVVRGEKMGRLQRLLLLVAVGAFIVTWLI